MTDKIFYRIKDSKDRWYKSFREIYAVSFRVHEQRSEPQREKAFEDKRYHLIIKKLRYEANTYIYFHPAYKEAFIPHELIAPSWKRTNITTSTTTCVIL